VTMFRPAMEQYGPRLMKKRPVFIQRVGYIEDAVLKGNKSVSINK